MPRRLRLLLIASLVLNVFAVGAIAGAAIAWWRDGTPPVARRGIQFAGDTLDGGQRTAFRQALRTARREGRPLAQTARAARRQAAALLAAPALDLPALDAALARARIADAGLRARLERRATAFAATLSQADRIRLSQGLLRRGRATDRAVPTR